MPRGVDSIFQFLGAALNSNYATSTPSFDKHHLKHFALDHYSNSKMVQTDRNLTLIGLQNSLHQSFSIASSLANIGALLEPTCCWPPRSCQLPANSHNAINSIFKFWCLLVKFLSYSWKGAQARLWLAWMHLLPICSCACFDIGCFAVSCSA